MQGYTALHARPRQRISARYLAFRIACAVVALFAFATMALAIAGAA